MNPDEPQQPVTPEAPSTPPTPAALSAPETPSPEVPQTPQMPVAPAPLTTTPVTPTQGKSKKGLIIGAIVGVIVLAGVIAYGVYAYLSSTPENMIVAAVNNIKDKKSLAGTYQIVSGGSSASTTINGDAALSIDPTNNKNGELIIGFGVGNQRLVVNALSLDGTLYIKADKAENLGPLAASISPSAGSTYSDPQVANLLKNLDNQWFELSASDVAGVAASTTGSSSVSGSPSPADIQRALDIYRQYPFIKADKTYADETVAGSNCAHFSVKDDINAEVQYMQALKAANLATIKVTDDDINKVKASSGTANNGSVELWISRDSKEFKRIKVASTEKGNEATVTVTLSGQLPTFDKFTKPAGSKPFSQLMTTLLGPSAAGLDTTGLDSSQLLMQ